MDIQIGNLSSLNWLWVVAAVVGTMIFAVVARRRALTRFATANLFGQLVSAGGRSARQLVKGVLVAATLVALVLAMLDIRWGKIWREVPQKGIEVMFVLDVSRSMLAEDASPNRLERAKQQIGDMLDEMAGDRVGLVAFAGDARQLVPLTSHYHDFKQTLGEAGPENVDLGGSRLGDALKLAADGFLDQTGDHKAIVVFTDGDDQESEPVKMAEQLHRERGIRIFTVGLGDVDQGARIPVQPAGRGASYLEYHGQQVWSKLNGGILQQVALDTGGAYIPAGTRQVDMAQVYHNYVAQVEQQDFETARINSYVPRYQWFIGLGLLLVVLDTLLSAARGRQRAAGPTVGETAAIGGSAEGEHLRGWSAKNRRSRAAKSTAAAVIAATCLLPQSASAADPASAVRDANKALRAGRVDEALAGYRAAEKSEPGRPEVLYNQAVAQYRNGQYEQARQDFMQAAASADAQLDAKVRYNLANCDYAEAVQLAEKDKPAAIDRLRSAISHYRAALDADPADTDARANIQLAQMLIDRLQQEEQQKKQDKQEQDQQQKQKQQDKRKQDQQKQQDQQQQDQQQDEQKRDKQEQDKQEQDKQKQQEQDKQEQDEQAEDKPQDQQPQQDQQQQDQQEPKPDEGQTPDSPQKPAAGQPGGVPQFGHDDAASIEKGRPMTKEEAQKMLQAVRDRELLRRLQQNRQSRRRRVPVDRDW